MRTALFVVASCLIGLTQSGLADSGFIKLSKPDIRYATFMEDRNACFSSASRRVFDWHSVSWTTHNLYDFADCMTAKGYRLDPNGYRAAWYTSYDGRHYSLQPDRPSPVYPY